MAKDLRSKYRRKIDVEEYHRKQEQEEKELGTTRGSDTYHDVEHGSNYFRVLPPHPDDPDFYIPRTVVWLSVYNDDGEGTRRTTIFNARLHGKRSITLDLVEEYVKYVKRRISEIEEDDPKEASRIADVLTHWQKGLSYSTTFVCYALKYTTSKEDVDDGVFGLLEMKKSVKDGMSKVNDDFWEESDEPISVDFITDPEDGYLVKIKYNKDAKKAADYYDVRAVKQLPLSDGILEKLDKSKTLSSRLLNAYKMRDFDWALEGLQIWEEENDVEFLEEEEMLEIMETCKEQVELATDDDELEEAEEEDELEEAEEEEEDDELDEFDEMGRRELKKFIKDEELDIKVYKGDDEDYIRDKIREALDELEEEEEELEEELEEEEEYEEAEEEEEPENEAPSLADIKKKLKKNKKGK